MTHRFLSLVPLLALAIAGCAPTAPAATSEQGKAVAGQPRTLRIVARLEVNDLTGGGGNLKNEFVVRMFYAGLAARDIHENPYPVMAESLAQLNTEGWTVSPDGTMRTIHRLRPGLTWHDGAPLTAEDFVFTLRAYQKMAEWGEATAGREEIERMRYVDRIDVLDPRTMAIHWKTTVPGAGHVPLWPRPRHLLEGWLDLNDKDFFMSRDYWTSGFVQAGAYRLTKWERGAFIEGEAFDGFALGRPKVDRIVLTANSDVNVTVAQMLAGTVDMAVDRAIEFQEIRGLKQAGWVDRTQGVFLLTPVQLRYIQIQARPDYVNPRALVDVRARRALLHAIDRPEVAEAMVEDRGAAAEVMIPNNVRYYPAIDRAITKYPFDVRRTEQLMAEVGYTKGPGGIFTSPTLGRFSPEVSGIAEGQEAQDATIINDYLRRAGFDAQLSLIPASLREGNDEMKGTFPALTVNNNPMVPPALQVDKFISRNAGSPATNWKGNNRPGYSNPEFDRLVDTFSRTLDPNEAEALMVQMVIFMNEELPFPPVYFNFDVVAHAGGLRGPAGKPPFSTPYANIHEWEWK